MLSAPLLAMADKDPDYSYLMKLNGVNSARDMKVVHQLIHGMDRDIIVGFSDPFDALKIKSDLRFSESDINAVLNPYGYSVGSLTITNLVLSPFSTGP